MRGNTGLPSSMSFTAPSSNADAQHNRSTPPFSPFERVADGPPIASSQFRLESPQVQAGQPVRAAHVEEPPSDAQCCKGNAILAILILLVLWLCFWAEGADSSRPSARDEERFGSVAEKSSDEQPSWRWSRASQDDLPAECHIRGDEYANSLACSARARSEWLRLSRVPRDQEACRVNYDTGKIECDLEISCEGGTMQHVDKISVKNTMEYDCANCHGVQHKSCCRNCHNLRAEALKADLRISGKVVDAVVCRHCEAHDLVGLESQPPITCSHNELDGNFKCSVSEHCNDGQMKTQTENMSFSCHVTPCHKCGDLSAKAQCCVECLEHYCRRGLSFFDRRVCKGCEDIPVS